MPYALFLRTATHNRDLQMLREAHMTWEQTLLEKQVKARGQKVLRRWRTLFQGVLLGAQLLEEYGDHN